MTRTLVYSYSRPPANAVAIEAWTLEGTPIEEFDLSNTDYTSRIAISCKVEVDHREIESALGAGRFSLTLLLSARADDTGVQVVIGKLALSKRSDYELLGELVPSQLGETVAVSLELIAREAEPKSKESLAPKHPGAILWSSVRRLRMFGISSRFPMRAIPFDGLDRYCDAPWYIDIDSSDVGASVMSAVRLDLNSSRPDVITALSADRSTTPHVHLVHCQLRLDIARQFISLVVSANAREQQGTWASLPHDSVGACALRFAKRVRDRGNLSSIAELREMATEDPARLEMLLQSCFLTPAN